MPEQNKFFDAIGLTVVLLNVLLLVAITLTIYIQKQVMLAEMAKMPNAQEQMYEGPVSDTQNADLVALAALTGEDQQQIQNTKQTQPSSYIIVSDSCGPHFAGECLRVRSGPSLDYPVVASLRQGIVLKIADSQMVDGQQWYQIIFDEWLRYPQRVKGEWYVAADYVRRLSEQEVATSPAEISLASSSKKVITIDRSQQMLYARVDGELFLKAAVSTGIELTPTPRGEFTIFRKTPSRYMQGPLPYLAVSKYYDLPGVPWNLYFTQQGAVIHGAYWHESFGQPYSSGCVNLPPATAQELYQWAEIGTTVIVQD